jgi:hypothetical protein
MNEEDYNCGDELNKTWKEGPQYKLFWLVFLIQNVAGILYISAYTILLVLSFFKCCKLRRDYTVILLLCSVPLSILLAVLIYILIDYEDKDLGKFLMILNSLVRASYALLIVYFVTLSFNFKSAFKSDTEAYRCRIRIIFSAYYTLLLAGILYLSLDGVVVNVSNRLEIPSLLIYDGMAAC